MDFDIIGLLVEAGTLGIVITMLFLNSRERIAHTEYMRTKNGHLKDQAVASAKAQEASAQAQTKMADTFRETLRETTKTLEASVRSISTDMKEELKKGRDIQTERYNEIIVNQNRRHHERQETEDRRHREIIDKLNDSK